LRSTKLAQPGFDHLCNSPGEIASMRIAQRTSFRGLPGSQSVFRPIWDRSSRKGKCWPYWQARRSLNNAAS
jgi:hypothetical protein